MKLMETFHAKLSSPEITCSPEENIPGTDLLADAVHLWQVELDAEDGSYRVLWDFLDGTEHQRALRLRSDIDRKRFICAHGVFRIILGRYLGIEPGNVGFTFNRFDKPCLASESQLEFSIAHSGDLALFAFTVVGRIGVDVERIIALDELDDLEKWSLSADERKLSANLPPNERIKTFYKLWTVKEAYLKMLGRGLIDNLNSLNMVPALFGKEPDWSVEVISPMSCYLAALATETTAGDVVRFRCNSSEFVN